jgi:hypothetical protein
MLDAAPRLEPICFVHVLEQHFPKRSGYASSTLSDVHSSFNAANAS